MLLGELAGGVQLEGQLNQGSALRIGNDARHSPMPDGLAHVAVADRRLLRIAAHLGLLHHALLHLSGKVGGVELRHQRVDALDQAAGGGLLELLLDRDEHHVAAAQRRADGDVVLDVAGQAIDLVDHDRVDVALLDDARQHGLQLGTVSAAGGLAAVGVLVGQLPALLADVAQAGLPLGRDGEALLGEVALGLLDGRDAQVDQASHRGILRWHGGPSRRPQCGREGKPVGPSRLGGGQQRPRQRPQGPGGGAAGPPVALPPLGGCRQRWGALSAPWLDRSGMVLGLPWACPRRQLTSDTTQSAKKAKTRHRTLEVRQSRRELLADGRTCPEAPAHVCWTYELRHAHVHTEVERREPAISGNRCRCRTSAEKPDW